MIKTRTPGRSATLLIALVCLAPAAFAQQDGPKKAAFTPPCQGATWWADSRSAFSDFDFWVGEWQVFDLVTGEMMGFDVVEKIYGGCAIRQHWRQMHDRFSTPGAPWRMEGGSHSALNADGLWRQVWLDNSGSYLPMEGALDENGVMVLESDWLEFKTPQGQQAKFKYRMHWDPQPDGTIHNWGFVKNGAAPKPEWGKYFDIVYRKNVPGGPSARYETPEDKT